MRKYLIYIIIISILTKKSMSIKCLNNNCECNQLEDKTTYNVECTSQSVTNDVQMIDIQTINNLKITNNKESIDLILNELIKSNLLNKIIKSHLLKIIHFQV